MNPTPEIPIMVLGAMNPTPYYAIGLADMLLADLACRKRRYFCKTNHENTKYRQSWSQAWELNPLSSGYEPDMKPFHPPALYWVAIMRKKVGNYKKGRLPNPL